MVFTHQHGIIFWNLVGFNRGYLEEYPIAQ